jgi:uncharacterized phage-associated protein
MYGNRAMNKFTLSNYIAGKYPGEVTPMKLQKLLYYCYVWQLVAKEKKFDATFEAWTHGPVEPDIYKAYKKYGRNPIEGEPVSIASDPLLDFIMESYAVYSAIELSKTTHMEKPWKKYKESGDVIPDDELVEYYNKQPFAKNFPMEKGKIFYPPKTSSHYSFTFDMEKDYVPVFDSIKEYLDGFEKENKRLLGIMIDHHGIQN